MFSWEKFNILPESRVLEPKFMEFKIFTPLRKSFLKQSPFDRHRTFQMIHPGTSLKVNNDSNRLKFPLVHENLRNKSLSRIQASDLNSNLTVKGPANYKSAKIHRNGLLKVALKTEDDENEVKSSQGPSPTKVHLDSLSFNKKNYFSLTPSPKKHSNLVIEGSRNSFSTPKPSQSTTPFKLFPTRSKKATDSFLDHFESSIRLYRRIRMQESRNPRVVQPITASITHKTQSTSPRTLKF
jgi:hypothetical protein